MINHVVQWYCVLRSQGTYVYSWKISFINLEKDTRGEVSTEYDQERNWNTNKTTAYMDIEL